MKPKFSILIANYNSELYFYQCYLSIIHQDRTDWEAIIVDDASTDNSQNLIRSIIKDDSRFKFYINSQNMGCGFTKARAAKLASAELCGFLDPDDTLESNALSVMIRTFQDNSELSIVFSRFNRCDANLKKVDVSPIKALPSGKTYLTAIDFSPEHFTAFRKSKYDRTEGINEKILRGVDQDLNFKMEEVGELKIIPDITYNYRIHNKSLSNQGNYKAMFWNLLVVYFACERRGISAEDLCDKMLASEIDIYKNLFEETRNRKIYRWSKALFQPFIFLYSKFNGRNPTAPIPSKHTKP